MNLEELKDKFIKKINDEYDSFVKELKEQDPEVIIDRAYEHVCKQEMVYIYENKDLSEQELKVLLNCCLKNKAILRRGTKIVFKAAFFYLSNISCCLKYMI